MRLKKLILHGFKSFADRTEFVFDSQITGIVGPNGCGKSNVVDGFKWVLGEQSAKSLRGDAMMDVIFNGSGGRKPSGMAEVTMVFDNPQREDGTRLLNVDVDEVSVGRRLFRDGTSEYQLNNQISRLKDIRELFLDTGVGVDAYSVIEQGRVAALLEANPEERRQIFEEAAGISKYKVKKKEAQRKLEKVDQNLLRLHDIVEEVERRLRSVKVAAGKARNYQEYNTRLNELRLTYSLQEYHNHHEQLLSGEKSREDLQFRLDDAAGNLRNCQNSLAASREQFDSATTRKQSLEYELVQAQASLESARHRQQFAQEQLLQIAEQIASFEHDRALAESKLQEVCRALSVETEQLAALTGELDAHRSLIEQRQLSYQQGEQQVLALGKEVENHKRSILDLMGKLAAVNSRIAAIEIERKNITAQQTRIGDRRRIVVGEIETATAARIELEARIAQLVESIASQQRLLEEKRQESANLGKQVAMISEQLGAAREHRSGLVSRRKLLEDLESRREGVSEGVKSVLRQREKFPFVRGLVADLLRVDVEHARVIEAALDGRDQWLVASDLQAAVNAHDAFLDLEGRVNIIGLDRGTGVARVPEAPMNGLLSVEGIPHGRDARVTAAPYDWNIHAQRVRPAIDLVRVEQADIPLAQHLLGATAIVETLTEAYELRKSGPQGWRFVTTAGEVLEADGTLRAGPLTASMGILSRRSELEAIASQVAEVDARIDALSGQVDAGNLTVRALAEEENALRNDIYQANTSKVELTSALAQNCDRLAALGREQPLLDRELQVLLDQSGKLKDEESRLVDERHVLENEQADRQMRIEESTTSLRALDEDLRRWSEELTAARVTLGQVQEKQLACQAQVARHTANKLEVEQQVERIGRSQQSIMSRRQSVEDEIQEARRNEALLIDRQTELNEQVQTVAAKVAELQQLVQELTGKVESLRGEHGEIEQQLHSVDMKLGELRVRIETLVQRTMEEFQLDLPAKYAEHTDGYKPADMDWDAVAAEIKELREKIGRLGNVNLDSLTELAELEQREQFLAGQHNDLTTSKQQLVELIDTINRESSIRFEQTFNAVREHFQGMFRKLFGGGKADIYLETELDGASTLPRTEDSGLRTESQTQELSTQSSALSPQANLLDAGIEIIARPPGKQPVSISQLSGGEKTMTCVALLLSVFKSKPSPFCILDEVDAALDEANNQRFNLIVQEFLEQSQFIIITHSKRTMQIADVLYGVTMQEQGVSKRVAVKFDQVDAQGRIAEAVAA